VTIVAGGLIVHAGLRWRHEAESERDTDWEDDGRLLSHRVYESGEEESLAVLAGGQTVVPCLGGWVGDHLVSPGHVDARETDGDEDVGEGLAEETKTEEGGEEVRHHAVEEVVEDAKSKTSPSCAEAANLLEVADCSRDLGGDRLVLDNGNLDVDIGVLRDQRLFLKWLLSKWLFGVRWWLRLDDSGAGGGFDRGQRNHDLPDGVVDGPQEESGDDSGDDDWQELASVHLELRPSVLVGLSILLELFDELLFREVLVKLLDASSHQVVNDMPCHPRVVVWGLLKVSGQSYKGMNRTKRLKRRGGGVVMWSKEEARGTRG